MASVDEQQDPYELLGIQVEATEKDIRTAYRQRSLKVHPDRNPNNPDAARKFHELNQAYELLLDPLRRLAVDAKLRLKLARQQRYAAYDNKRKNLVNDLEERERAFKKARVDKDKEELQRWRETEEIKEKGRKLREEKEKEAANMHKQREAQRPTKDDDPPALGPLDTTIKLRYSLASHPTLTTVAALAEFLNSRYRSVDTDSIVISLKPPKKAPHKPPKNATALVPFTRVGDAYAAVSSGLVDEGMEVSWAGGSEPEVLGWLRKVGKLEPESATKVSTPPPPQNEDQSGANKSSSGYSSFPESFHPADTSSASGMDYESLTLLRLQQAERERLEREIREAEAAEET